MADETAWNQQSPHRAPWTAGSSGDAVSRVTPTLRLPYVLTLAKWTWFLTLASMLPFCALPWLLQERYRTWLCIIANRSGVGNQMAQTSPTATIARDAWAPDLACAVFVLLALIVPRVLRTRLHGGVAPRTRFADTVEGAHGYRDAPDTRIRLKISGARRLAAAYYARATVMLVLIAPVLCWATAQAMFLQRISHAAEGRETLIVVASPLEYLPKLALVVAVILANAPSPNSLLGAFAVEFQRNRLLFERR